MKITDLTVKRYRASHDPRVDAAGIQIVHVHTDAGASGMGFVSAGNASGDLVAMLLRRNLRAAILAEDPLLTTELWRRMHETIPGRGGEGRPRPRGGRGHCRRVARPGVDAAPVARDRPCSIIRWGGRAAGGPRRQRPGPDRPRERSSEDASGRGP